MNSDEFNWPDVRVFLAAMRTGSTLKAARALGLSQPTVSRRIDALEHGLKLRLFERDNRGLHPTQEARALLPKAEALEAAAAEFMTAAARAATPNVRPIRLTAPRVNFSDNLAAALADFTAANPGVSFEFVASYKILDLVAGEADVAIRVTREVTDDRLICRRLTTSTASIYGSESYAARHGLPASAEDLAGHKFVVFEHRRIPSPLNAWLLERIIPDQIVSRCSDIESLSAAVRAGLGLGPIATSLAADEPTFRRCFPPPEGLGMPVWLLIGPDAWRRPEVKAFARFFVPRFRSYMKHTEPADPQ